MTSPVAPDLASLDTFRPAALDPTVWTNNLAALQESQPDLAQQLAGVELPPAWRGAWALDDTLTLRLEEPGQVPRWLGGTAMPRQRAVSLLEKFEARGQNCALADISSGAELNHLLAGLTTQYAVFAFSADLRGFAAVLRVYDYSAAIRAGRCYLLPCDREAAFLVDLLRCQLGLQPPTTVVLPDLTSPERVDEIQRVCRAAGECLRERAARLDELAALPAAPSAPAPVHRLAVLSLSADPRQEVLANLLRAAARELGWDVVAQTANAPRRDHVLVHAELLARHRPDLTILLNHVPGPLPTNLAGRLCIWWQYAAAVPSPIDLPQVTHLAASPRVAAALSAAGVASDRIVPWSWACTAELAEQPADAAPAPLVLVAADLPPLDCKVFGLDQESQQRLWARLRVVVGQVWETPRVLRSEQLLLQAQRECGVDLTDAPLRRAFLELIEATIVPGVVLERVLRALADEGLDIAVVGRGWEASPLPVRQLGSDFLFVPEREKLHPLACVFADRCEPLSPTLLEAAARGWPILMLAPAGAPLAPHLGDVLQAGQHFEACKELADIRRALEFVRGGSSALQRRVSRARDHVRTRHTYAIRLQELAAVMAGRSQV